MDSFVVVLEYKQPGVIGTPTMPGLEELMRDQVEAFQRYTGQTVSSPPQYLSSITQLLSFSIDPQQAQIFPTFEAAQAAIDCIPELIRPSGLRVQQIA